VEKDLKKFDGQSCNTITVNCPKGFVKQDDYCKAECPKGFVFKNGGCALKQKCPAGFHTHKTIETCIMNK